MSVFTDVAAEGILLAGGGRAILLQIADPAVGAGVAAHSDFANRPLERFANTVTYAYSTVFATPAELAAVVRRVNAAHGPVHSTPHIHGPARSTPHIHGPAHSTPHIEAPEPTLGTTDATATGVAGDKSAPHAIEADSSARTDAAGDTVAYNAFEPGAQLWVAATLYQSAITVYEKVFGPLADADAEEVYQQYAVLGTALQVPAGSWPADREHFATYWSDSMARLEVSDDARRVASDLLHPRTAPLMLRLVLPVVRLVTAGLLSPELRRAFVLPWSPRHQRRFDRLFAATAVIYPRLPRVVRTLPKRHYLSALRRSLTEH
ncbi:oxygenase MpaB family protein [Subtercola lobariae]|uniref:ER-bound oxygenase mpaB/mpaB'/Rubber oxygenase catalytic domain-containing protein n=1 Tax=Subtercola lobariae TaxID=1588641 RepID=A0A917B4I2_9MICO|nr:oxygenase MpaB family protein [Subtercola lobariae]GGF19880.1 hypothetical protein GCM10011399_11880 [Subtercola lobariae]